MITSEQLRARKRLETWAAYGRRADLPHLAVELGLPRLTGPAYQTHAHREGWWSELILTPHDDDRAWRMLTQWAQVTGAHTILTMPLHTQRYGHICEAFTQIHLPGPTYRVAVRIWTHVAADWTGPGHLRQQPTVTSPQAMADAHLLAGIVRGGSVAL
jgi:hypothetical protein